MSVKRIIREPLLHFVFLGAALFFAFGYINRDATDLDAQTIVVSRDKLLTHIQYRSRAFDATQFGHLLDSMSRGELDRVISDYVREEALYREAKALQLDKNDYVARLRLIQQLEFITRGFVDSSVEVTDEDMRQHYEANKHSYYIEPKVTFTHVFFSQEKHGANKAEALARAELQRLNRNGTSFSEAPAFGDRFLYHVNYVGRKPEEIASHFGESMRERLFALEANDKLWQGPFRSTHGFHLVIITRNEAGYQPQLEEVRGRVALDVREKAVNARFEESIQSIVRAYEVKLEDLQANERSTGKASS